VPMMSCSCGLLLRRVCCSWWCIMQSSMHGLQNILFACCTSP
jgi:hypothetical protein